MNNMDIETGDSNETITRSRRTASRLRILSIFLEEDLISVNSEVNKCAMKEEDLVPNQKTGITIKNGIGSY